MKCSLGISPILFFPLFLCIDHWGRLSYLSLLFFGTLHSNRYSFPFLLCFLLLFFSQLFVRPPQTTNLPFCISFPGNGLNPCLLYNVRNLHPQFFRHSIRSNSLDVFLTSTVRDFIWVIPEWSSGFPYFLQFKSEFGKKEFMIWAPVSSRSYFCRLYRASPSLAAKNIINLISVLTIWWCPSGDV